MRFIPFCIFHFPFLIFHFTVRDDRHAELMEQAVR